MTSAPALWQSRKKTGWKFKYTSRFFLSIILSFARWLVCLFVDGGTEELNMNKQHETEK
jgi:hypothetical protein